MPLFHSTPSQCFPGRASVLRLPPLDVTFHTMLATASVTDDKRPIRVDQRRRTQAERTKAEQISLRTTAEAKRLLAAIADFHGFNLTHALEYALRKVARDEGLKDPGPPAKTPRKRTTGE